MELTFWLLVLQPVIDLVTSLSNQFNNHALSVGALIRTGIMVSLFFYIAWELIRHKSKLFWLFIGSFLAIAIMLLINFLSKEQWSFFQEINFAFKTSYYLVVVYLAMLLIRSQKINQAIIYQATKVISLIVGSSYWLAIITNTSINSYTYDNKGYSGWFYAANELSVMVIILLALAVIRLKTDKTVLSWLAFIFMLSMVPMVGTKTAFLGGMLIISLQIMFLLIKLKFIFWRNKHAVLFFGIILIFVCLLPMSPIMSNTQQLGMHSIELQTDNMSTVTTEESLFMQKLLSSRNVYYQTIKADYKQASGTRKAFGLGYAGDYKEAPKLIEMDFFDMFFSYGVIGSIFLLLPLLLLLRLTITALFPLTKQKCLLFFTLVICFAIAFLAGHVLFAPSVMTYITILFVLLGVEKYDREYHRTHI